MPIHPPYENDEASYGQVPAPTPLFESAEQAGLYKLAVQKTEAVAAANEALTLLERNKRLLSEGEQLRIKELRERLAKLS